MDCICGGYNSMDNRKKGVLLSYICILTKLIVGLLYVPVLLSFLSDKEYGLYQLMGSLISYLSVMDFGLSATVIRYYTIYKTTKNKIEAENVLGIARRIYLVICLFSVFFCFLLYKSIDVIFGNSLLPAEIIEAKNIFIILSANVILTLLTNVYVAILNSHEKFVYIKVVDITNSILQLCFIFGAMRISNTALSVVIMLFIINIITSAMKVIYSKLILKVNVKYYHNDPTLVKRMLTFSVSVFVVSVVDMIYWKTDQIILGAVAGTLAVAVYGVASQIYWNYMPLSTAIQGVFLPSITEKIAKGVDDSEISDLFIKVGRVQFVVLGAVLSAFILLGKEFIIIISGKEYIDAYWICLIIMIPFTIDLIENVGLNIMQARNKYSFRAVIYSLAAVGNIILTCILAKKYTGIGCAVASAICMLISNGIIMNWYYYKKMNIDIPRFWKKIGKIAIMNILIIVILGGINSLICFSNIYCDFLFKACLFICVYCVTIYKLILQKEEKEKIIKVLTVLKIKRGRND